MNLYVVLKNIQTITYEWTSDKLYVEADETFWELCAVGRCGPRWLVGRCARVVVNHVRPCRLRTRRASYNANSASCEVLIGIPIWGNTCNELLCIDDAECVETKSSDKNIVSHQIGVGTRGHELAIEINLQKRGYVPIGMFFFELQRNSLV